MNILDPQNNTFYGKSPKAILTAIFHKIGTNFEFLNSIELLNLNLNETGYFFNILIAESNKNT